MSGRVAAAVAAVLMAIGAAGAGAGSAAAGDGPAAGGPPVAAPPVSGYSPAQVEALADAAPIFAIQTPPVRVSPAVAYATASEPGAAVEGSALAVPASTVSLCWQNGTYIEQWGIWPLYQKVISHDTWCSTNWSHLYYHSNYVTTAQVLCSAKGTFHFRIAGGVSGQMTDEWQVGAHFSCPTNIPYVTYNPTRSFNIVVAADGGYYHG